jgi:hypothetical protein
MSYYIGSLVRLSVVFTDLNAVLADPTTVVLTVIAPDRTVTTPGPVVHDSTGNYHFDLQITQAGTWNYEWVAVGALVAVKPGTLEVLLFPLSGWSYSGNPGASPLDEVRFLIADTDQSKKWTLQDAEINYAVTLYSDSPPVIGRNFVAAATCAESILAKLKAIPQSKKVGDLSIDYGNQFAFYKTTAYMLRQRATLQSVAVYAGGLSIAEKEALAEDTDRVQPAVRVDGMDRKSENGDSWPWGNP